VASQKSGFYVAYPTNPDHVGCVEDSAQSFEAKSIHDSIIISLSKDPVHAVSSDPTSFVSSIPVFLKKIKHYKQLPY
jgi:hypothetical protein